MELAGENVFFLLFFLEMGNEERAAFTFSRSAASPGQLREKMEIMEKKAKQGLKRPNRFNSLETAEVYFGGRENTGVFDHSI